MISSEPTTDSKADRLFRRSALITLISVYLLVLAGGIVRSTGAGMGCPDWPRCFGSWVPPTEVSQLPVNYKEIYGAKLKGEVEFNVVKTWTEYANRLLGAVTGLLVLVTLVSSLTYRNTPDRVLFRVSLLAFVLTCFQGWIGAKVVSFELLPVMVTIHMFLAIVIVFLLLFLVTRAYLTKIEEVVEERPKVNLLIGVLIVLTFFQIMLGTQVREEMDVVISSLGYLNRADWIGALGMSFYIHRSFSILVVVVNFLFVRRILGGIEKASIIRTIVWWEVVLLVVVLVAGITMAYGNVPAFSQPIHLLLAVGLIGVQFVLLVLINKERILSVTTKKKLTTPGF